MTSKTKSKAEKAVAGDEKWRKDRDPAIASHRPAEVQHSIESLDEDGEVRLRTVAGRLFIECDGEVVLDQYGTADLRRFLEAAFQAVS